MSNEAVQPPLLWVHFNPLPHGADHYVAALQNHKGELDALEHASEGTWERLTPLVHFLGGKDPRRVPRESTVAGWVKRVADVIGRHACFLDVLRLDPLLPIETKHKQESVLTVIYQQARRRRLRFVPVLPVDASSGHLSVVRSAITADRRGVALRYRALDTVLRSRTTHADVLKKTLSAISVEAAEVDLLIDLEFMSEESNIRPDDLCKLVTELTGACSWRNVVLLGTSMPATLGGIHQGTLGSLPRFEWQHWSALKEARLKRMPSYGDYGVQHPKPPQDAGGLGMRANIRYTIPNRTLIARGAGAVVQTGIRQYADLCEWLVRSIAFCGSDYSWGDSLIQQCASGTIEPGAQPMWRGAATSHHLKFVTDQLTP